MVQKSPKYGNKFVHELGSSAVSEFGWAVLTFFGEADLGILVKTVMRARILYLAMELQYPTFAGQPLDQKATAQID